MSEPLGSSIPSTTARPNFADLAGETMPAVAARVFPRRQKKSVEDREALLRQEFAGQSALLWYHADTIMRIRRSLSLTEKLAEFYRMWGEQRAFLLSNLNSRWLVSACDTIIDHDPDATERSLALAGALFTKTIKLYETERHWTIVERKPLEPDRAEKRLDLHDGLFGFGVGYGDMVVNLIRRSRHVAEGSALAGPILLELLRRADRHDTVLRRLARVHVNERTRWAREEGSDRDLG